MDNGTGFPGRHSCPDRPGTALSILHKGTASGKTMRLTMQGVTARRISGAGRSRASAIARSRRVIGYGAHASPLRRAGLNPQAGVRPVDPRDGFGPSVVRNLRVPRPRRPLRGERSCKPMPCAASKIAASRKPTARTGAHAARAKSRPHTPEGRARRLSVPGRRPRGAAASVPALSRGRRANGRATRKPPKTVGPLPSFKYA